tara:strand:- start:181 stop:708 length:528 start_codon:yes stop_codon:yes gene_type:complete
MEYLNEAQKDMELAKTMVQNGMYTNIDDALKEIQTKKETSNAQPQQTTLQEPETKDDYSLAKRVAKMEQVLQDFGKFFVDYKNENEQTIRNLNQNLLVLRNELSQLKPNEPSLKEQYEKEEEQTKLEETPKEESKTEESKEENKEKYNERQGEFTSDDVQIEDIFSNAHGKMMKN